MNKVEQLKKDVEELVEMSFEFAKLELKPGTPEYNLQQGLLASAQRYRNYKNKSENNNE